MLGLLGKKVGMTRVFRDDGESLPVTVVAVTPNRVTRRKTQAADGVDEVQLTCGRRAAKRVTKPAAGLFAKAGVAPGRLLRDFRLAPGEGGDLAVGGEIGAEFFTAGQFVDVRGVTIGKGFAGVMKRHGYGGGRATHGNSKAHRKPGSIGQNQDPGRVFPGKKMAGRMGGVARTCQNLEVVRVDVERNLLLIKGAVPGARGADLVIRPATKKPAPAIGDSTPGYTAPGAQTTVSTTETADPAPAA